MGSGIAISSRAIARNSEQLITLHHTRSYWYFTTGLCVARGIERLPHPVFKDFDFGGSTHGNSPGNS
jgi:hypothetical protein